MLKIKDVSDSITEDLLITLIGNYIHVPTNPLVVNEGLEENTVNVWFGGRVAGYEASKIWYDFKENEYKEDAVIAYSIVMTDGASYIISESSEVYLLTEYEFKSLFQEYTFRLYNGDDTVDGSDNTTRKG